MNIELVPVQAVDSGDVLSNGDVVIDGWHDKNGQYLLKLERWMPDGSTDNYTVAYPLSSFMRLRT